MVAIWNLTVCWRNLAAWSLVCCFWAATGGCSAKPAGGPAGSRDDGSAGGGGAFSGDAAGPVVAPFEPDQAFTYVAKVKNVLVGLAPTDAEVQSVLADSVQLKTLIGTWMEMPQYQRKMRRFFELAFQQTQVAAVDFADQAYPKQIAINNTTLPLLMQNAQQSFARTMLQLIDEGQPLTAGVTTQKLMMTTALKEMYAFLDVWQVDNNGRVVDRFRQANPSLTFSVGAAQGPIPMTDTLDPTSPNYMHWYNPDVATYAPQLASCAVDPIVFPPSAISLHFLLYGSLDGHKSADGTACPNSGGTAAAPQLVASDFSDWTMVEIRQPTAGESVTKFYDLPALRTATQMVLSLPRVGFFSTPAFFANWQTNVSNQMRVTLNQTLIVALGSSVDGTDPTVGAGGSTPSLDAIHSMRADCVLCHRTLDPLRSIFSATYSWNYHSQADASLAAQKGMFVFRGMNQLVSNVAELASALGQHPLFAAAWAQKLCTYVNSAPCLESDPEFLRVVAAFRDANYSWNVLVTELLSSPLTTNAVKTDTVAAGGAVVAVSRRDHLCAALDNRLGLLDICALDAVTRKQLQATVPQIVSGLPSDGYGRGSTAPVLPNKPTLFYRSGTENICQTVAGLVVDVAAAKQTVGVKYWSSSAPDVAIADFVGTVMALVPSDPRASAATSLLKGHFTAALQQGATASDALKSTFVVACLAPSSISVGL